MRKSVPRLFKSNLLPCIVCGGETKKGKNKMKKLMIAAAIICAAAMSQAASISWKANGNYVTKEGTVQTAVTADAGKFVLVYLGNGTADWTSATVVNEGTVAYGTGKSGAFATASGSYSFTYGAEGAPINGDIFGVMFQDGEGNLRQLETTAGAPILTEFEITGMSINTWTGSLTFANSNYTVASVPEPTSALMLLLGVAGLALRRRRA